MLQRKGFAQHMHRIAASNTRRDTIIPIGALVAVPDMFGVTHLARIVSYGISGVYARELRGEKVYTVRGVDDRSGAWGGGHIGMVERDADQITIIDVNFSDVEAV